MEPIDDGLLVLVHGFAGWGREELGGYLYWGGTALDIEECLRAKGFAVYTAAVGPFSSNHDRACELFYQLRGGRVDYGEAHARTFGHARFGRTYEGAHPRWSAEHPVHLVGHSMGGQTVRVLVELLAQDYFGVGSDVRWVRSVATLSSPHDGTTLATMVDRISNGWAQRLVSGLVAFSGSDLSYYDFKLDQWNLFPAPEEGRKDFLQRVLQTMGTTEDFCMVDLLPSGARALNERVRTHPEVFYLSWATGETTPMPWGAKHRPELEMNPFWHWFAFYMGHYTGDQVAPHEAWWPNDGIVNTVSQKGPHTGRIVPFDGTNVLRGVWNYMGLVESTDHGKIIGHLQHPKITGSWHEDFFVALAARLTSLGRGPATDASGPDVSAPSCAATP